MVGATGACGTLNTPTSHSCCRPLGSCAPGSPPMKMMCAYACCPVWQHPYVDINGLGFRQAEALNVDLMAFGFNYEYMPFGAQENRHTHAPALATHTHRLYLSLVTVCGAFCRPEVGVVGIRHYQLCWSNGDYNGGEWPLPLPMHLHISIWKAQTMLTLTRLG